jgi:putative hemolysin
VYRIRFTSVLAVLALLFLACPSKHNEVAKPLGDPNSETAGAANPASPGGTALVPETKAGQTVLVTINDGTIDVANHDQIAPGPAVVTVTNASKNVHNLFIDGPGVQKAPDHDIAGGGVANINVDLQAGKYTFYCPVLDHRTKGESIELIVKSPAASAPSSTTAPATDTTGTGAIRQSSQTPQSTSKTKP